MTSRPGVACLLALLVLIAGCGGGSETPQGRVHGKVTLDDAPVTAGQVEFFSSEQGIGAMADISADGTYVMKDRLPVGQYGVMVRDAVPEPGQPPAKSQIIPGKYADAANSGLTFSVAEGENTFDIQLSGK